MIIPLKAHFQSTPSVEHVAGSASWAQLDHFDQLRPLQAQVECQKQKIYYVCDNPNSITLEVRNPHRIYRIQRIVLRGAQLEILVESPEGKDAQAEDWQNCIAIDLANTAGVSWANTGSCRCLELQNGAAMFVAEPSSTEPHLSQLFDACMLAQFEQIQLFKAVTASIISIVGSQLPDISQLLHNSYNYKDWCELYIQGEWTRVFCYVDKSSKSKGKHKIKFFKDDKSTSSKNVLCYISETDSVEDLLFVLDPASSLTDPSNLTPKSADEVDPLFLGSARDSRASLHTLLAGLTTLRYVGEVHWPPKTAERSRSSSLSFSTHKRAGSSGSLASSLASTFTSPKKHARTNSTVSTSSSDENHAMCATTSELLIRPIPHNGVHRLESMVRAALPMMGCLGLYGRPLSFKTTRTDADSLVLGLPRLPVVDYFAREELPNLFEYSHNLLSPSDPFFKYVAAYKTFLQESLKEPHRDSRSFSTLSDVLGSGDNSHNMSIFTNSCSTSSSALI
ncbi:LAMI_0A07426g1_1 [Lachancea mirantina]|uniref:LAMI_0A07426g1_1 n=1 Tax=Lachancea mirantina TaxID=1230905 RepID=A0A1G4IRB6_9SACH|nr:LAMI_0A07426g1_1 [Lachancea mirantina]